MELMHTSREQVVRLEIMGHLIVIREEVRTKIGTIRQIRREEVIGIQDVRIIECQVDVGLVEDRYFVVRGVIRCGRNSIHHLLLITI
jgi:hypothetical protein